ncbi:HTH domain-containing protein [Pedobacter aquatilis]|uniref:HTH domain-containing protein n=1 Tax=Pedobacter aquatilis TaxID=351343 RepID=UPI00292F96BC|nr:HTH domain-containing protein [Pedobacter aquatilis]
MMSIVSSRENIVRLLYMLRHNQVSTTDKVAARFNCSSRTIKNYLAKLRKDGYLIKYDKGLKRYVLRE